MRSAPGGSTSRATAPGRALGPGDHFGEIALLTDAPRNARVTAHTAMRVFRLARQGFIDVVARSLPRSAIDRSPDRNMEH